ncbi:MAG TPA: nucleoside-triphosphatase, partial [Anaerolineae bacterium]|nr:nucleoside-triphosphatase [Anaerolineae bacterium]
IMFDEIGKMELFSSQFQSAAIKAAGCGKPIVATAMLAAHPWVDAFKALPGVKTVEVTPENRDRLTAEVLGWLESQHNR